MPLWYVKSDWVRFQSRHAELGLTVSAALHGQVESLQWIALTAGLELSADHCMRRQRAARWRNCGG